MITNSLELSRTNSVVIFDNHSDMVNHVNVLQDLESNGKNTIIFLPCKKCTIQSIPISGCLANKLFPILEKRTQVGCANPIGWFKNRKDNKELSDLTRNLSEQKH